MTSLLRDLPAAERPRERLLRHGPETLNSRDLLAILLRTGRPGRSALDIADEMLKGAPDLGRFAGRSVGQLRSLYGLGTVQAVTLLAALELSRRAALPPRVGEKFTDPERVRKFLRTAYAHLGEERTGALLLDARNRLIRDFWCYRGTLDRAMVEPRGILKEAIADNAAGVIVYHNHPSGDPTPSSEDVAFTRRLFNAAEVLGVRLVDHMIVGREGVVSLREAGVIPV
jgi:DNA repair protein RadC